MSRLVQPSPVGGFSLPHSLRNSLADSLYIASYMDAALRMVNQGLRCAHSIASEQAGCQPMGEAQT